MYSWSKTVFPIAALFSFRMLGLFLLIPVFSVYAAQLQGATPQLIGFALGGYGLTQGLLQIPFGLLSDKFGRKPLITLGLLLFGFGSLIGALTDSIYGMILARTLQGTGAIGSVLIALLSDLTTENQRTKAMAVIGVTIGTSFSLAMVIGPILAHHAGLSGIFSLTLMLALLGILLLHLVIPSPSLDPVNVQSKINPSLLKSIFLNPDLQRLNLGIFCQHFILTATFFAVPLILKEQLLDKQWHFYLPLVVGSFILMIPFIYLADRKQHLKKVFLFSILLISLAQGLLTLSYSNWPSLCLLLFAYFVAFNTLEALLPSLVSKQAPLSGRGTALGIYSTSQFLGLFAGGALSGLMYHWTGIEGIFMANMLMGIVWFITCAKLFSNK